MTQKQPVLTQNEHKFIECMADGHGFSLSAAAAGYVAPDAYRLLLTPRISRLIEERARSALRNDLAPRALKFLGELVDNKDAPLRERRAAAQAILDKAGYVAPRAAVQEAAERSVSEMSLDELAALVERLERERARRAIDVSAPNDGADDSQVTDMLS